jgi:aromatic ring hydroxylase
MTDCYFESEKTFGCGLAAVYTGRADPLRNVNAEFPLRPYRQTVGGVVCSLPAADDFQHKKIGTFFDKYLKGKNNVPTEKRIRTDVPGQ